MWSSGGRRPDATRCYPARQPASFGFSPTPKRHTAAGRAPRSPFTSPRRPGTRTGSRQRAQSVPRHQRQGGPAEGVVPAGALVALGSALGGWSLHLIGRSPSGYVHNLYGKERARSRGRRRVSRPEHTRGSASKKDDGRGWDRETAYRRSGRRRRTYCPLHSVRLQRCWRGAHLVTSGVRVGDGYSAPFTFNGSIIEAVVEVTGPVVRDPLAELAAIMSEQ